MRCLVVAGIGQSLRGDDGAGLRAVRLWSEEHRHTAARDDVRVETCELPGLSLLDTLAGCDAAIVVDAVRSGARPGTLHLLREADAEAFGAGSGSAHGWGLAETLALGRRLLPGSLPSSIVLIGIGAGSLVPGGPLSPPVRQALSEASRLIEREVARLLRVPDCTLDSVEAT